TLYHEKNVYANRSLGATDISAELGQLNSGVFDNKLGVSQTFQFPIVFKRQKALNEGLIKASKANEVLSKLEAQQKAASLYVFMQNYQQQKDLLQENQKIYQEFLNKANLRLKKGETNQSEVSTAIIQLKSIENQMRMTDTALQNTARQLQYITNSDQPIIPSQTSTDWSSLLSSLFNENHPLLEVSKENIEISALEAEVEKSKKTPSISLGYNNQSFRDVDHRRYSSGMIGLQVPIFNKGINSSIEAAKVKVEMAKQEYKIKDAQLKQQYDVLQQQIANYDAVVSDYESHQIPASNQLQKIINRQLLEGEINFLDWVILNNQIIDVKTKYLESKLEKEKTLAELYYYTNN
ncbi:MAG: TolC family protein, partial [Chryseobacterium sp.]|nr:TolC family protein [Candidatus Chryseobacterium enterohippi]